MKVTYKYLQDNKSRDIRCKISLKKGSFGVGSKNRIFSDVEFQKWGSFSMRKCNFKPKFANFMLKLPQDLWISQHAREVSKNLQFVKFDTKVVKRGSLGVDWEKRGVIGCNIGVKRGVYWQALDLQKPDDPR